MAMNDSNWTIPDNEDFELFDENYAYVVIRSLILNMNRYVTPFVVLYGDLVSIVALAILIGRRLWLKHEGYIYLAALLACNVYVLTVQYGSYAAEALFGLKALEHTSRFTCKMVLFFWRLYFSPVSYTTLLLINSWLRLFLTQQSQPEYSRRQRYWEKLARIYCTPFVSSIVTVTMVLFTCFSGVWALWMVDIEFGYCRVIVSYTCQRWCYTNSALLWGFPVVVLLPVLTTFIWYTGKARRCFQFFRMDEEVIDVELIRLTLWLSVVVFISEFPMIVIYSWMRIGGHDKTTFLWRLSSVFMLIHGISLGVLSSLCLFCLTSFRNEIRSRLRCFRSNPPVVAAPPVDKDEEERRSGDVQLDAI